MKVNTLEAGLNSTAVMAFTRPEVTLQESVTCCSHSLGFRKRNLALDCWPLTIFNFTYDACQQRIATVACVAEVFWDHGVSCSRTGAVPVSALLPTSLSFGLVLTHWLSLFSVGHCASFCKPDTERQNSNCYQHGLSGG